MYKLFYYPRNASWAPHLVLEELGVDYELELVDRRENAQKSKEYLSLNPTGRIPTLVDNETVIFESAAICLHLCEKHPEKMLIPEIGSSERAEFFQWLFYLTSTVQPELMIYFYPDRHISVPEASESIVPIQEARVSEMFGLINDELKSKPYLIGSNLTVCDYFLFMLSHWASGFSHPPYKFEYLGRYLRRLASSKTVKKVCEIEGTSLELYT